MDKTQRMKDIERKTGITIEELISGPESTREVSQMLEEEYGLDSAPSHSTIARWRKKFNSQLTNCLTTNKKRLATNKSRETYNDIIDSLRDIRQNKNEYAEVKTVHKEQKGKESLVLLISDVHVGKVTNTYNSDVAYKRINEMTDGIKHLVDSYLTDSSHAFDNLHIIFLGDIVDGEIIYNTQIHHIDKPAIEQVSEAAKIFAPFLKWCEQKIGNIEVHCVRGNHGRNNDMHEHSNWDIVFYELMKTAMMNEEKINFNISQKDYGIAEIKGHRFMFRHGQSMNSQSSTSSAQKKLGSWFEMHRYDAACFAHYHSIAVQNWNDKPIFRNGTFVTDDKYAEKIGEKSDAQQMMFGVTEERVPTFIYYCDLK